MEIYTPIRMRKPFRPAAVAGGGGIAFRSAAQTNLTTTVSPVVTAPAGMAVGDAVVISFGLKGGIGAVDPTPAAGFTLIGGGGTGSGGGSCVCIFKLADAADVSNGNFTITDLWSTSVTGVAGCALYSGVDQITPQDPAATYATPAQSTTPTCTAITPNNNNSMIVCSFAGSPGADPANGTPGSSVAFVERLDAFDATAEGHVYIEDFLQATAASVTGDFTLNHTRDYGCAAFALKAA